MNRPYCYFCGANSSVLPEIFDLNMTVTTDFRLNGLIIKSETSPVCDSCVDSEYINKFNNCEHRIV